MQSHWVIEAGIYGDDIRPLLAEIRHQGMVAEVVPYQSLRKGATVVIAGRTLDAGACAIGYGTFPFARQIQLHH
jgi:hypothetical protein